jgi:hypothetical protein
MAAGTLLMIWLAKATRQQNTMPALQPSGENLLNHGMRLIFANENKEADKSDQ